MRGLVRRSFAAGSGVGSFGAQLIQPGALASSLVTFSRSQVSAFSTAANTSSTLVEYAIVGRLVGA